MAKINVKGTKITIISFDERDYISLTDIAKAKNPDANAVIANWMRNRNTIEYLGVWEYLYNPHFKPLEFEGFKNEAGANAFTLSPQKWVESTNAIGIIAKSGRYGGTYAHKDIAFKFASWISVEFELYIVKEFQRLKEEEQKQLGWSAKRELAKINYHIHTDAICLNLDFHKIYMITLIVLWHRNPVNQCNPKNRGLDEHGKHQRHDDKRNHSPTRPSYKTQPDSHSTNASVA
jgi:hypothetical protein